MRLFDYALTAIIFGLILVLVARLDEVATRKSIGVAHVHDGDTLTVDGQRMRLRGIDAPEYRQNCVANGQSYGCGREGLQALKRLSAGRQVNCEGWERDRFNRLLAVCYAGEPRKDLNAEMVKQGWAVSFGAYRAEEAQARKAKLGIWRGEFQRPGDWRAEHDAGGIDGPHDLFSQIYNWVRQLVWP